MDKNKIKEALEKGYIHISTMFEVVGQPKEHVEKSIRGYISEIKKDPQVILLSEEYAEPKAKEGLWSTFCESEMLVLGLEKLSWLCINYTPSTIEILAPSTLTYRNKDITMWSNDLLSKLHKIGIITKSLNTKNKTLERNMSMVVRNCILALIDGEKSLKAISKLVGVPEDTVEQFLNTLEHEKKVKKKNNKYIKVMANDKK